MKILAKEGINGLIDELVGARDFVFKNEVQVVAGGVVHRGQLVEKTNQFLVLKQPSDAKIASGPDAGKKISSFSYIHLSSIIAVSVSLPSDS